MRTQPRWWSQNIRSIHSLGYCCSWLLQMLTDDDCVCVSPTVPTVHCIFARAVQLALALSAAVNSQGKIVLTFVSSHCDQQRNYLYHIFLHERTLYVLCTIILSRRKKEKKNLRMWRRVKIIYCNSRYCAFLPFLSPVVIHSSTHASYAAVFSSWSAIVISSLSPRRRLAAASFDL